MKRLPKKGPPAQHRLLLEKEQSTTNPTPSLSLTIIVVSLYVLSGCIQPIFMTVLRRAGLADSSAQLYMLFYYSGPASAMLLLGDTPWPSQRTILKACGIALWDIGAQTMNYTGAVLAGPTIFAIVYSSVTIWAALYSQLLLKRKMNAFQWMSVLSVFGGLALTATDSMELGDNVTHGLMLVVLGSSMHGLFYVLSEAVMTTQDSLSVTQNCAIQGMTAFTCFGLWQLVYTVPHVQDTLLQPMQLAHTSLAAGLGLLLVFALLSFVHSITFYHTLRHLEGGSTSAAVFKGLQAVLVFLLTHFLYCGRVGGAEMCFSTVKCVSLITVSGGVCWYGCATTYDTAKDDDNDSSSYDSIEKDGIEIE